MKYKEFMIFTYFLDFLQILLFHIGGRPCTCRGVQLGVRGQLLGLSSFFSTMWVPRIKPIIWLGSKCLYPLDHFAGLICEHCFLYVRMHAHHTCGCLQRPEEGIRSHGAAVPGGVSHLTWEQNVGPLEGQHVL